jgi:hypothetical protein
MALDQRSESFPIAGPDAPDRPFIVVHTASKPIKLSINTTLYNSAPERFHET